MPIPRVVAKTMLIALMWGAGAICGQTYPSKPIRMIAPEAGGTNDFVARVMSEQRAQHLNRWLDRWSEIGS